MTDAERISQLEAQVARLVECIRLTDVELTAEYSRHRNTMHQRNASRDSAATLLDAWLDVDHRTDNDPRWAALNKRTREWLRVHGFGDGGP